MVVTSTAAAADNAQFRRPVAVAISGDGQKFVSNMRTALGVWDFESKQLLLRLEGHTAVIRGVAISVDGRFAVSGSDDKTLRVWNLDSGKCVSSLEGHTGNVDTAIRTYGDTFR